MKFTIIMKDPKAETFKLVLEDTNKLHKFLTYLFHDLSENEVNASFTLTLEKDTPECKIQLIN